MATALKRIKSIQCLLNLNYLVQSSASWKKPCLGLRFHSDILNSKCRKIQKKFFILTDSCETFKFIYFTGWATKSDGFFSLLFNFLHAKSCRIYSWLIPSVQKMIYFDLLYLSFPGSLGYIVCQPYESLYVLAIFDILFNMGARWFCLSCIRRDLISSASCVKR